MNFIDPKNNEPLIERNGYLINSASGDKIAPIVRSIPRFVKSDDNYAENFGWQWNHWENTRSLSRNNSFILKETILHRTGFQNFDLEGKTILECGMGGGDDTEILLEFPFSEVHGFDMSTSVERCLKFINDKRLTISQASIFDIPYPDYSFDVVYCHRVLQHTPDPVNALKSICKKVKPGGILFAHAYKHSWRYMMEWKYKYRCLTTRMDQKTVYNLIEKYGNTLHKINNILYKYPIARLIAYNFIPFYHKTYRAKDYPEEKIIEFEKLVTFDALTPKYDNPMKPEQFFGVIENQGFKLLNIKDPKISPMYCTATRVSIAE